MMEPKYGLYGCMQFLDLPYIHFDDKPLENTEEFYSFGNKKADIFVIVPKFVYDHEPMMQSFVATIIRCVNKFAKQTTLEAIFTPRYWMIMVHYLMMIHYLNH